MLLRHQASVDMFAAPNPPEVLRLLDTDEQSAKPSIQQVLGALLLAEDLADRYATAHGAGAGARTCDDASTVEAFNWVQTAFQDIAVTLEAIPRTPSPAGRISA